MPFELRDEGVFPGTARWIVDTAIVWVVERDFHKTIVQRIWSLVRRVDEAGVSQRGYDQTHCPTCPPDATQLKACIDTATTESATLQDFVEWMKLRRHAASRMTLTCTS